MIRLLFAICLSIVIAVIMAFGIYYLDEVPVSTEKLTMYNVVSRQ